MKPIIVELPFNRIQITRIMEHFRKHMFIGEHGTLRHNHLLTLHRRIQFGDCILNVGEASQQRTILKSVGPAFLVLIEELQQILSFLVMELDPLPHRLIHHMNVMEIGANVIQKGRLTRTDVAVERKNEMLHLLRLLIRLYTLFMANPSSNFIVFS